ncbi:response regulator transcription factor [Cytobacillus firmus]|uniref:Response regulator transcription factor n=1 Tax=Cytobacillus firmus TaxID=1399 RepID=A0AA46SLE8_CYTFI|nr:response regulator transcription factor [Cytobacillus firmus]UYG98242.1 response regulator transcription factor [Cytobacillus firmus]
MINTVYLYNNVFKNDTFDFISAHFSLKSSTSYYLRQETLLGDRPDLIIICCSSYNDESAFILCQVIERCDPSIPIVIVSDSYDEIQAVKFLEVGADDYIIFPFRPREFVSRIKAHVRRSKRIASTSARFCVGALDVFPEQYKVCIEGKEVNLKLKEFELLLYFLNNRGRIISREELLESINSEGGTSNLRLVDTYVSNIRGRLRLSSKDRESTNSDFNIKTVKGKGYVFEST